MAKSPLSPLASSNVVSVMPIGPKIFSCIARSKAAGLKEMIAVIADKGAEASIKMHENFGFTEIGRMGRVGYKFERWLGTVLMQKSLK